MGDTFSVTHEASARGRLPYVRARKIRFELVDFLLQDCDDLIGWLLPRLCVFLDFTHPLALPFVKCVRESTNDTIKAAQQLGYVSPPFRIGPGRWYRFIKHYESLTALTFFPSSLPTAPGWPYRRSADAAAVIVKNMRPIAVAEFKICPPISTRCRATPARSHARV